MMIIGITTLVFGFFQMHRAISEPLEIEGNVKFKTADELEEERLAQMKEQDTDADGLNDYDELYLFRTSPFLADSDSDGLDDGTEVAQSSDPNCPQGKSCRMAGSTPADSGEVAGLPTTPPNISPDEETMLLAMEKVFGGLTEMTPESMNQRLQELTADELRQFMLDIGVPEDMLQQTDDATMRQLLAETLVDLNKENPVTPEEGGETSE
ncbi:hypothetical protein KKF05_05435 [Patescibacteria group bacterium]|nr:hypothetical protein [Patescibacteria group bacterium]